MTPFRIGKLLAFTIGMAFFYTVILWILGGLYDMIHPWVGMYAHSTWYFTFFVAVVGARFIDLEELKGEDGEGLEEFLLGTQLAAMVAFPFHFALICQAIEKNFPGQFFHALTGTPSLASWLALSWYNVLEALLLDTPGIYEFALPPIRPASFFSKTMVFLFRLSMNVLYILAAIKIYTTVRKLHRK